MEFFSRSIVFLKKKSKNFKILIFRSAISEFFIGFNEYTNLYIFSLGANLLQLGSVKSLNQIVKSISAGPIGWAIDRYSLRKMLLLAMILEYLAPLSFALSRRWEMVIPAIIIQTVN